MNTEIITACAEKIRNGGLVVFPTETVYGLGADAYNEKAVARIFETKNRPFFDPLIVHIDGMDRLADIVTDVPDTARKLMEAFWPGPLTLILPKTGRIPDIVTAGLAGVGVRMPANETARTLIRLSDTPVAAPSANLFGSVSPTRADHIHRKIRDSIDMLLDDGPCTIGVESTIISFMEEKPALLRAGGLALEDIEKITGRVSIPTPEELKNHSPGRTARHYSTDTVLIYGRAPETPPAGKKAGLLCLRARAGTESFSAVEVLSGSGSLNEAACNLFAAMRRLDALGLDILFAEPVPDTGLGRAINDRLKRAAGSR